MSLLLALQTPPAGWLSTPEFTQVVPTVKFVRPDRSRLNLPLQVTGFGVGKIVPITYVASPEIGEFLPRLPIPRPPEGFGGPGIIPAPLWMQFVDPTVPPRAKLIAPRPPEGFGGPGVLPYPWLSFVGDPLPLRSRLIKPLQVTGFGVGQIILPLIWQELAKVEGMRLRALYRPHKAVQEEPETQQIIVFQIPGWRQPEEVAVRLKAMFKTGQVVFAGGGSFFQLPSWWPMDVIVIARKLLTPPYIMGIGVGQSAGAGGDEQYPKWEIIILTDATGPGI